MLEVRITSLETQEAYICEFTAGLPAPTPGSSCAQSPTRAAEYDEGGRLTTRSKGKGHAN
jgi:hypothetical protein